MLAKYADSDLYRERTLLSRFSRSRVRWLIATPDFDIYDEAYQDAATFTDLLKIPSDARCRARCGRTRPTSSMMGEPWTGISRAHASRS